VVVDGCFFSNNQLTLIPCFTFIHKTGVGLPEIKFSFTVINGFPAWDSRRESLVGDCKETSGSWKY